MRPLASNISISKARLAKANDESIRLGFNRSLDLGDLPDQVYNIVTAFEHIGYNGGDHDSTNIRLFLFLPEKPVDGQPPSDGMTPALLDITTDSWAEVLQEHRRRLKKVRKRSRR